MTSTGELDVAQDERIYRALETDCAVIVGQHQVRVGSGRVQLEVKTYTKNTTLRKNLKVRFFIC